MKNLKKMVIDLKKCKKLNKNANWLKKNVKN